MKFSLDLTKPISDEDRAIVDKNMNINLESLLEHDNDDPYENVSSYLGEKPKKRTPNTVLSMMLLKGKM